MDWWNMCSCLPVARPELSRSAWVQGHLGSALVATERVMPAIIWMVFRIPFRIGGLIGTFLYFLVSGHSMGVKLQSIITKQRNRNQIPKTTPMTCVQIGANVGKLGNDPIWSAMERRMFDRVMLIEPLPGLFNVLKKNCDTYLPRDTSVTLVNTAVGKSDDGDSITLYTAAADNTSRGSYVMSQLSSTNKTYVSDWVKHFKWFECEWISKLVATETVPYKVPCAPLADIIEKHGFQNHVDILDIDTEGYDLDILNDVDWKKFKPLAIVFEHSHTEGTLKPCGKRYDAFLDKMKSHGYEVAFIDTYDTTLVLNPGRTLD